MQEMCTLYGRFFQQVFVKHLYTVTDILGVKYKMVNKTNEFPTQNMFSQNNISTEHG